MILSKGRDDFLCGEFSRVRWSAPLLCSPCEFGAYVSGLDVSGRTLSSVHSVGGGLFFKREWIEAAAAARMECDVEEGIFERIPSSMRFARSASVSCPVSFRFEDGGSLDVQYCGVSKVRVAADTLKGDIICRSDPPNFDASGLFSPLIGARVSGLQADGSLRVSDGRGSEYSDGNLLISDVRLMFDDGRRIVFEYALDRMRLTLYEPDGEYSTIDFSSLVGILTDV